MVLGKVTVLRMYGSQMSPPHKQYRPIRQFGAGGQSRSVWMLVETSPPPHNPMPRSFARGRRSVARAAYESGPGPCTDAVG
ncbi:hypothetical protein Slala03_81890 [Streptomyces lavendulae subsp. lavendulae]|nr:hypothetical protein Slala03_81890 [Streptomyces lavendulae subsp. lavendulae]